MWYIGNLDIDLGNEMRQRWVFCKICKKHLNASFGKKRTNHLQNHTNECQVWLFQTGVNRSENDIGRQNISNPSSYLDSLLARESLAHFICAAYTSISFGEHPAFAKHIKVLIPQFQLVSWNITRCDIDKCYNRRKSEYIKEF